MFIVQKEPKSIAAEAYKTLRTNIQYSSYDSKLQVLVITSANPQEGKSMTAGNLALSFAQDGKRVLLMDCDLRRPTLHKKFNVSNEVGLAEVLVDDKKIPEVKHIINDNLDVLTSGKLPPNPAEMLGSESMKILLEQVREHYDYAILDTAPVRAVTDSQVLSTRADGVILVVEANKTKKDHILQAKENLDKVGAAIVGTILNSVTRSKKEDYGYYYYGEEKKKKKKGKREKIANA
ncbi:MAG: CpsD/CapB family tyrosine-protein kinase [Sarcina sp.]